MDDGSAPNDLDHNKYVLLNYLGCKKFDGFSEGFAPHH
jgi:hypothetical protein